MMAAQADLSLAYNNFFAPEAVVWIEGTKLSEEGVYFTDLEITKDIAASDTFSFSVSNAISDEFTLKHDKLFALGNKVEIHIGYADSDQKKSSLSMLFVGIITNVNWHFSEDNYLDITVEGADYAFFLMKHSYKKPLREMSVSDAVTVILNEVYPQIFENIDVESSDIVHTQLENQEENDYLYFRSLAEKIGYNFYVDRENLYFKPAEETAQSTLTVHYGRELLSFTPELNVQQEVSTVKVVGLEFSPSAEPIVGEAKREQVLSAESDTGLQRLMRTLNTVEYEVREAVKSVEEAEQRAAALMKDFSFNFFKAEMTFVGLPDLVPGMTLTLKGLGERFSRDYYVEKTVHTISEQGYETAVSVRSSTSSFKALS